MSKLGRALATLPLLTLVACASTTATAPASAPPPAATPTAAESFVAYAEGGEPDVPWAATVRFSIAGEQVAELAPEFADRRGGWVRCPGGVATYEERRCPVSALTPVRALLDDGGRPVLETSPPEVVGCNRYRAPWSGATTTWIRPDERHRSCLEDFAIAVGVDGSGDVVAVDLVLSGP